MDISGGHNTVKHRASVDTNVDGYFFGYYAHVDGYMAVTLAKTNKSKFPNSSI
jgi:hypothetical protein